MSDIEVTTTVTIKDSIGREIVSLTKGEVQYVTDNPRFWATCARGAIQATERSIATMLISQFGDTPDGTNAVEKEHGQNT